MAQISVENADTKELESFFRQKLEAETDTISVIQRIKDGDTNFTLLDVRDADSFEKAHVKGAVNIPLEELGSRMSELDDATPVLVYCYNQECMASTKAARQLASKGYKVQDVIGGFERFESNEGPMTAGPSTKIGTGQRVGLGQTGGPN